MIPIVSIIVPVFNVKSYLCECLESIITQTYDNLEIIVVDDGSDDGSEIICDVYQKKDYRVHVVHQCNQGLSAARNTGLNIMHGDIVAFLDADDAYLPNMIEVMVNSMIKENVDIVVCGYYDCYTQKRMTAKKSVSCFSFKSGVISAHSALINIADGKINIPVWNKIYKSALFERIRFLNGHVYEDMLVCPYLFEQADRVLLLEDSLLLHRLRPKSISSTYTDKNMLDWLYAKKQLEKYFSRITPEICSKKEATMLQERYFTRAIYNHLLYSRHTKKANRKVDYAFIREIEKDSRNIRLFHFRTKLFFHLYKLNPVICLLSAKWFKFIRSWKNKEQLE